MSGSGSITPDRGGEAHKLLTGAGTYVADVRREGMLHAAMVRSADAHGRLVAVGIEEAAAMPGVHTILTSADLERPLTIPVRAFPSPELEACLQPILARDRVRYVGEPVAIIVADSRHAAEDAAELVDVVVEPLPACVSVLDAPPCELFSERPDNVLCERAAESGEPQIGDQEVVTVEYRFTTNRHSGMPIEPRGVTAEWSDDGSELHVWGPTKFLDFTRRSLAGWFEINTDAVTCHSVKVGGAFGVRGELYPEDFLVPWTARRLGRPVSWVEDRQEHFLSINHGRELTADLRLSASPGGELLGIDATVWLDVGAYTRPLGSRLALLAIEELPGPYRWGHLSVSARAVLTNKTPVGTVRGPVAVEMTFARERALDMLAARLEIEPGELRRRNLIEPSEMPYTLEFTGPLHAQHYDSGDFPQFFDRLEQAAEHLRAGQALEAELAHGERTGVGMGLFLAHSGLGEDEEALVSLRGGRLHVTTAAAEIGQGMDESIRQIAARALMLDPGAVTVASSAAHIGVPNSRGTFASRTAMCVGSAVADGCTRLELLAREQLARAERLHPDEISLMPKGFRAGSRQWSWAELADLEVVGAHHQSTPAYGFGGHVAAVRVDENTGQVTVERLVVAYDCGAAINEELVHGQLRGAAVQGLGGALLEEIVYDDDGQMLTTSFIDYLLPTLAETPPIDLIVFEAPTPTNRLGAKGAGEAGVIGVAAAVANAVADALATPDAITATPLSPSNVLRALAGLVQHEEVLP